MLYSEQWKMWSCANICIAANGRVLDAIEKRQAERLAARAPVATKPEADETPDTWKFDAAKPDSVNLATFLSRKLFELGDEPEGQCKRIQFMVGEGPAEVPAGGFVESALAKAIRSWIWEYDDVTKGAT